MIYLNLIYQFVITLICFVLFNSCKERASKDLKINYYSDGKIQSIKSYKDKDTILNGECVWFYPNGFVEKKIVYIDDNANGHEYYFYESGRIKSHRFLNKNKLFGIGVDYWDDSLATIKATIFYDSSGNIKYEKDFNQLMEK